MEPTAEHVGRRATVRVRIGGTGPSGGPAMTDIVGLVRAVDADSVTVQRRDGRIATVPRATIVAFHPIAERPGR